MTLNGLGRLAAPFPYFGGKSRWIDLVWERIGKVGVWSERMLRHRRH